MPVCPGQSHVRELHMRGFAYYSALLALRQAGHTLDVSEWAYCNRWMIVSIYVWREQARPMAVELMLKKGLLKKI
jgi:hypothetical protein